MPLSNREEQGDFRRRTVLAGLASLIVFGALGLRVYYLQIATGENWLSLSENNRIRLQRITATRGRIYDIRGEALVDNRPSFDVVVVPEDTQDLEHTIHQIDRFIGKPGTTIDTLRAQARQRPAYEGLVVHRDVDWESVVTLETHELDLPGVSLEVGPLRTYLHGPTASHLLGYVGEVSESELSGDSGYRMGDLIGKFGAEHAWEDSLRGVPGGRQIEVDYRGRRLQTLSEVPETQGHSLILTFDRRLQQFAEQLLTGHTGSIVALRPKTGEILAMASQPAFDPNIFARGVKSEEWRRLMDGNARPLNNRAIQGQYPPGSTFKIVTAAAALEEGVVTPFTRIFCGGAYRFGKRRYRCWKRSGHGSVNLHEALEQSCDVYFYQVGQRLGVDTIAEYARLFGLGAPTGIRLNDEKPGLIPTTEWKKRRFGEQWFSGETLSVAIGQGYVLTTPLQMASVIATVANGGTRHRPHFVRRVETADGTEVQDFAPEVLGTTGFRRSTLHQIRDALTAVVNAKKGTGRRARLPNIEVAGKTGTAQVFKMGRKVLKSKQLPRHLRDHAWFVAFAPVEDPEIAIAVMVEHADSGGGRIAAPIAHDLADYYFALGRGRAYSVAQADAPKGPKTVRAGERHPVRVTADLEPYLEQARNG